MVPGCCWSEWYRHHRHHWSLCCPCHRFRRMGRSSSSAAESAAPSHYDSRTFTLISKLEYIWLGGGVSKEGGEGGGTFENNETTLRTLIWKPIVLVGERGKELRSKNKRSHSLLYRKRERRRSRSSSAVPREQ